MLVFRCTKRLVRRFDLRLIERAPAPICVLGDWYANLLNVGSGRWVLCQSERSLLPVILPARDHLFPEQFGSALGDVLSQLHIGKDRIALELSAASEIAFSQAHNRQVLGVMNDFANIAKEYLKSRSSDVQTGVEASVKLAETPSSPIGYESPDRFTVALFQKHRNP